METDTAAKTIEVEVTYAGARDQSKGQFKRRYPALTLASVVRTGAMSHFQVADSTDASGQQINYTLMLGGDTVDVSKSLADLAKHEDELEMRLVRQVTAG